MSIRALAAVVAAVLSLATTPAAALEPATRITQYRHTAWRVLEGSFESAPNAITQTPDGYLLIATDAGLVRFDGVRFQRWSPPNSSLFETTVLSLLSASDGTLWIGTSTGLLGSTKGRVEMRASGRIAAILEDHKRRIWVARSLAEPSGAVCQVVGERPACFGADEHMRLPTASALAEDTQGDLWIGASNQLMRWREGHFDSYLKRLEGWTIPSVTSIAVKPDGSILAAVPRKGFGTFRVEGGRAARANLQGIDTTKVSSLFIDRDKSLWMGTVDDGIYRISGTRMDHFRLEHGLSSNNVRGFFQDLEGNLWVATSNGIDCFRDSPVVTFSSNDGLPTGRLGSMLVAHDGTAWVGHANGLVRIRGGISTTIAVPGNRSVNALFEDHTGRLWVGLENMLTAYERGVFRTIDRSDGSALGTPIAITEDRENNIWVSVGVTSTGGRRLFRIRDLHVQEELTPDRIPVVRRVGADPTGGIWLGFEDGNLGHYNDGKLETFTLQRDPADSKASRANTEPRFSGLTVDADGSVWLSTWSGLVHFQDHEFKTLTTENGLPCNQIVSSIRDDQSTLWLYTKCGFVAIAAPELEQWWQHPARTIGLRLFDVLDGAALPQGPKRLQPVVSRAPDGRLWFVNESVLQIVDPHNLPTNRIPPPVHIEELRADRKEYPIDEGVRLPANSRDIEIGYTGLSFSAPEKVNFRYRLEGRDPQWREAGARRRAYYSDLPPGQYRFQVTAANSNGIASETGAELIFSILPAYYQMTWFRVVVAAALLTLFWEMYRRRRKRVAREFDARVQERVNERTRIARELHDTLLQSLHGLMFRFQAARNMLPARTSEAIQTLDGAILSTEQAIAESRDAIQNLRSAAGQGDLGRTVAQFGQEFTASEGSQQTSAFRVTVEGESRGLPHLLFDEVSQIAHELVRNAFRHAHARHIEVEIRYEETFLCVRIRDDGIGIDPTILTHGGRDGHWGLRGVRERAERIDAELDFWSEAGAGTEIQLKVPAPTTNDVTTRENS